MPKTKKSSSSKKRTATKRAERMVKAHASQLPHLETKTKEPQKRLPGYKAPARGVARYPWAIALSLALIALSVYLLYANRVGPFAPPPRDLKLEANQTATAVIAKVQPTATAIAGTMPREQFESIAYSPCLGKAVLDQITNTAPAPNAEESAKINRTFTEAPKMTIDTGKSYCAGINTNRGLMVVELKPELAANTVNNFVYLAQNKYYDGLTFHRVVPDAHIIQSGDPKGDGTGGPGYAFNDETVKGDYLAGTIAMANAGANTNGSQFFINLEDNSKQYPEKKYNLFGQVVKGLDVALTIQGPDKENPDRQGIKPDVINHVVVVPAP